MKIQELNEILSNLFDEKIVLMELIDQSAKKWYEKSYKKRTDGEFQTGLIYGVDINDLIEFDFTVKNIDNLFKSFFTNFINKYMAKKINWSTGECYTKEEAINIVVSSFNKARSSNGIMYSTNYGIGVWFIYIPKKWIEQTCNSIEEKLKELNISFKNEYSDAQWVFRYCFDGNYIDHNSIVDSIKNN